MSENSFNLGAALAQFREESEITLLDNNTTHTIEIVSAKAKSAAKGPTIIRAAKECLNGIDPVDVKRSYRFEQGFTFELNLSGVSGEARQAFVEKRGR